MNNFLNEKVDFALEFATKAHSGQSRKTDKSLPYIYHPVATSFILKEAGFNDDVVIAGILHDTLEDTDASEDEIKKFFGDKILLIILELSENKELNWEDRKKKYIRQISNGSNEAKAVATADKLQNVYSIIKSLNDGVDTWSFFNRTRDKTIDFYKSFYEEIKKGWNHAMIEELGEKIKILEKISY